MPNDRAHRSRGGSHARISALLATCALACTPLGERQEGSDAGGPRIELAAPAGVAAPAEERVRYTLELLDPEQPLVGITIEVRGDSDGESEFGLSEGWAGIAESGKDLELVEARGARDVLASERPESFTWRVRHAPGEPLALVFELGPTKHRANPSPPEYYLPILEPGLLHLIGAQALPAPSHLDGGRARPIELAWRGFGLAGWRTISSFGTGDLAEERALDGFRHALFLAGDLRLLPRAVRGSPVWIAMHGSWSFGDDEFADLVARVVALGREFFAEFAQPFYLVSMIPIGTPSTRGGSYGGTGLSGSFALFLTSGATLALREGGGIPWLLAHELFHEWNGQAITLAQPEQLGYWFSEGFTNFYARRLLYRAGLLSEDGFLASWNRELAAHAANPARHVPAERVREAFWSDRSVGEVPYQRGDLIALHVDHAIALRSGGARSLDDLMRELVRRARSGAGPFTNEALLAAIGEYAGDGTAAEVREWALEGVEAELAPGSAGPGYEVLPTEVPTFDTGFDHELALKDGTVQGVRAGGPAERAGLRDGMRLAGWSVNFGD
jgi:predicted metalloprotease with PDZ domain